jgi:hypothetical protein
MKIILLITVVEVWTIILLLLVFVRSRNKRIEVGTVSPGRPPAPNDDLIAKLPAPDSFDTSHWAFINEWHMNDQGDDRRPMIGAVAKSSGSLSARRSFARRSHQLMYKEWSGTRRD